MESLGLEYVASLTKAREIWLEQKTRYSMYGDIICIECVENHEARSLYCGDCKQSINTFIDQGQHARLKKSSSEIIQLIFQI